MLVGLWVGPVSAQQIYKWTDAQGKVHFGNAPPPDAKDIASDGSASRIEAECQAKAKRSCERDSSTFDRSVNGPSTDVARRCREQMTASCVQSATSRTSRIPPPQRTLVTERVSYDPKTGDHLVCHMTCPSDCTGSLEIWGADNLARAENPGSKDFTVRVTPSSAGSAYCRATTADTRGAIVLNLMRGEAVVASAAGK